jgi:hypothetical protein
VNHADPDLPAESVTATRKKRPLTSEKLPMIVQAAGSKCSPEGSAPDATEQVKGGNPPVKVIEAL